MNMDCKPDCQQSREALGQKDEFPRRRRLDRSADHLLGDGSHRVLKQRRKAEKGSTEGTYWIYQPRQETKA